MMSGAGVLAERRRRSLWHRSSRQPGPAAGRPARERVTARLPVSGSCKRARQSMSQDCYANAHFAQPAPVAR